MNSNSFGNFSLGPPEFLAVRDLALTDLFYHSHAVGHGGHILGQLASPLALEV